MNTELNYLAPYFPHGLIYIDYGYEEHPIMTLKTIRRYENGKGDFDDDENVCMSFKDIKPILHPLSDYIDINSKAMIDLNCDIQNQIELNNVAIGFLSYNQVSYRTAEICFEKHIDLFNLIPQNKAVDINTLTK